MNRIFAKAALLALLGLLAAAPAFAASYTVERPDGSPVADTNIYIYDSSKNADSGSDVTPYGTASSRAPGFTAMVTTDKGGHFDIDDVILGDAPHVVVAGSAYNPVKLGEDGAVLKTTYRDRVAPHERPLNQTEMAGLVKPFKEMTYNFLFREGAHRALISSDLALRAYAATWLGRYGQADSVPFLIDALSDESVHVGANYSDPGMATTRYRAKLALKKLTGEDFGFDWDATDEQRRSAVNKWKEWLNERDAAIALVETYLKDHDMTKYRVYRAHLSTDKSQWGVSLMLDPPTPGAPVLMVDRRTHQIDLIPGR